jgi:hypothetical protein
MKRLLLILSVISLNGCAVVAVGAAAVSVTTTAVGVAWDVGKAGVKGVAAVGSAAGSALSGPDVAEAATPSAAPSVTSAVTPAETPAVTSSVTPSAAPSVTPDPVEIRALKDD